MAGSWASLGAPSSGGMPPQPEASVDAAPVRIGGWRAALGVYTAPMHEHARFRPALALAILLAALSLLVGVPAMAQDPAGVLVTDPTSGVSVTMPIAPQSQEATIPGTDIVIRYYLAVDGEAATSFSVFDVTEADGGYSLDGGVQGSADGTRGTVVASTPIVHQGHEGRDFELAVNDPGDRRPGHRPVAAAVDRPERGPAPGGRPGHRPHPYRGAVRGPRGDPRPGCPGDRVTGCQWRPGRVTRDQRGALAPGG